MTPTLQGYPIEPDASGALAQVDIGDLIIRTEPQNLRALGEYLIQAAREMEAGVKSVQSFTFADAEPPRTTPTKVVVFGVNQHGA
jgi:hypothetical protein